MTDITALWNTNAFFAYLLSVRVFKLKWEPIRLAAVVLATLGATAVVYGGTSSKPDAPEAAAHNAGNNRAPLAGDMLTLAASVLYGMYQVFYKLYAALPTDPEELLDTEPAGPYTRIPAESELEEDDPPVSVPGTVVPPFGLYPNMLTSFIGICTFLSLWIPIPILQSLGIAHFALPTTRAQVLSIIGISLTGVTFNAGFMVSSPFLLKHHPRRHETCAHPVFFFALDSARDLGPHRDVGGQSPDHRFDVLVGHHLR